MDTESWRGKWESLYLMARTCAARALICLLAGTMLFASREVAAQLFAFRHYQQAQGLGNLSVNCLLQDREGFVWACTDNGLYRYDGVTFERIGELQGIRSAAIQTAAEDAAGRLWVATAGDLYRRDGLTFKPIRPEGRHLKLAVGSRIAVRSSGPVLVIDGDELLELSDAAPDGQWHSRAFFPESMLATMPQLAHLNSVHVDRLDRIWLGCGGGICRVDEGAVRPYGAKFGVPEDTWVSWLLDRDGRMWARGLAHVAVLEPEASQFEPRDPPHAALSAEASGVPLVADPQGRILTSTDSGLSRWQGGWQNYSGVNGIPSTGISAMLASRDGQVWLGMPGRGIERWAGYGQFESWTRAQGLGANSVSSVLSGLDHSLLLATRAGCSRLNTAASLATSCPFVNLPPGEIRVMAQGRSALWIGMATGELFRIVAGDYKAGWVANIPAMRKLYVDSREQLWIGTARGVATITSASAQVESLSVAMPTGDVDDITEDAHGALWFATRSGLRGVYHGGCCRRRLAVGGGCLARHGASACRGRPPR
jgi:ligand-binding sensor domain-containing protein